jgi:hypothetical protein
VERFARLLLEMSDSKKMNPPFPNLQTSRPPTSPLLPKPSLGVGGVIIIIIAFLGVRSMIFTHAYLVDFGR